MRKFLTVFITLLLLTNLQVPYSHSSNSTYSDTFDDTSGDDGEDWLTILSSPAAFFSYCFAAILFETGKYTWANRAKIGQCFGDCLGGACNKFSEKTGLFYQSDEHDLDSVLPSSLPANLTDTFKALHDALLEIDGVQAAAEPDGDWYYDLGDRSYGIFNVFGLPGAKELFSTPIPQGEVLNKGDKKLYTLLSESESRTLIKAIGRRNHKLEEKVLAGFHDWFTSGKIKIISEGNVRYAFIGDYYENFDEENAVYAFKPQILFRMVMGDKQTGDIFDDSGNLSFNMTWNKKYQDSDEEDFRPKHKRKKKRKKAKKKKKRKSHHDDEYDVENPHVPFYNQCKKGWCHPDELDTDDESETEMSTIKVYHHSSTITTTNSNDDFADIDTDSN